MPFLTQKCPKCNKLAEFEKEWIIGSSKIVKFKCGHFIQGEHLIADKTPEMIESLDGKRLFKYQQNGINFALKSGARCLIADEMGLGKTVQALGTLAMNEEKQLPFLAIVKSSLKVQWQHETMRWLGKDYLAQVISSTSDYFLPGFHGYIMSYDLVSRFSEPKKKRKKSGTFLDDIEASNSYQEQVNNEWPQLAATNKEDNRLIQEIKKLGIKTIILDEVQQIKNTESKRTIYVRELCKHVEHIIALSGTPIKNNALEYFPILNILQPTIFPRFSSFQMNYCDTYFDGFKYKAGGLRDPKGFLERTKNFIIRREMKDVKDDLPSPQDPINRRFSFHELGEEVEKLYAKDLQDFMDYMDSEGAGSGGFSDEGNILKYLTKMRHTTGLAKIDPCIDYCMEFLGSCDRKMLIFVHHHDVAEILQMRLASLMADLDLLPPIRFEAGDISQEFVQKFKDGPRIAIVSTLAGGEGMDGMQHFCHDTIMLERQWNPANEEQAEKRISQRIGQQYNVTGTYFVAVGTVDEFFSEIVERKREIVSKTLSGEATTWNQSSLIKELTERLETANLKKWSLK
jgi:SWI/SNF-related matrix-associated actin-dependent regulator 1 of chromatin subfamily A